MSMIAVVGRKSRKNRILILLIYCALIMLGGTMVVPFMVTFGGSASNDFDYDRFRPVPRFLWSTKDRFVKCLVPYFNFYRNWTGQMKAYCPEAPAHWSTWSLIGRGVADVDRVSGAYLRELRRAPERQRLIAGDYAEFAASYPLSDKIVYASRVDAVKFLIATMQGRFRREFPDEAAGLSRSELRQASLTLLGREWSLPFEDFYSISFDTEMGYPMDFQGWFPPMADGKYQAYNAFKEAVDAHLFTPGVRGKWLAYLAAKDYAYGSPADVFPVVGGKSSELERLWLAFRKGTAPAAPAVPYALRAVWYKYLCSEEIGQLLSLPAGHAFGIDDYNRLAGTDYEALWRTPFPVPVAFNAELRAVWHKFLQERFPLRLVAIVPTPELDEAFGRFVQNTVKHLRIANQLLGTRYDSWRQFKLTAVPVGGATEHDRNRRELWKNFVKTLPVDTKVYASSEIAYQKFLLRKYGSLDVVNQRYGWTLSHVEEAFPPFMTAYAVTFDENEYALAFFPLVDNYKTVTGYLLLNGNAIAVTAVLIALTLVFTLTVNPLAAYALSRFNLRGQDKILLFLLATMAFPAMVSAIPAYLLMRDIGLLNTYWALVIPGAANGMSIFILKGFFDSLPMELFEAATIDGAGELQIFRIVAMPLVKPILAINSLTAFITAYNGWQWALIICQKKSMWTIAVWLYQASTWWKDSPWIVSAGFVIASVPTFLVFVSCQKIILRGIIIPSMK